MESLCGITLWFLVLWCLGFTIRTRAENGTLSRQEKLEQILRTLRNYPESKEDPNYATPDSKIPTKALTTSPTTTESLPSGPFPHKGNISDVAGLSDPHSSDTRREFYRVFYGTKEGLDHLKKQYGPNGLQKARAAYRGVNTELEDVKRANDHYLRILTGSRCKTPVPSLIRVQDLFPDPSTEYLPRCTVLHRCSDSSGCCDSDAFHCVASAMQEVALHFLTLSVGRHGMNPRRGSRVKKLLFTNHTACHCQLINDLPRIALQEDRLDDQQDATNAIQSTTRKQMKQAVHHDSHNPKKCRECPVPFSSRTYRDGRCGCDCFDREKPCLKIKRGRAPMSEIERRCVEANYCHIPACEYGMFDPTTGYCPRRHDQIQRIDKTTTRRSRDSD